MYDEMPDELRRKLPHDNLKDNLYQFYVVENKTQYEISEIFGVSKSTICRWMKKIDIETGYNGSLHPRFSFDGRYPTVSARTSNGRKQLYIHRLVAFAHFDGSIEDFSDKQIHHRNKHKHDSRPENLEILSGRQHQAVHHLDEWAEDDGWPVLLSPKYTK